MKKTFAEIRKELSSYSETIKFDSSSDVQHRFEVEELKHADEFKRSLDQKCRDKIESVIEAASERIDQQIFKKLRDDIWEFRINHNGIQYRFLAFWNRIHEKSYVIITHGFVKKTGKVPRKEFERASDIRLHYLQKANNNEKER